MTDTEPVGALLAEIRGCRAPCLKGRVADLLAA